MKRTTNYWLLVALLCGLSLGVASCKDSDDGHQNNASGSTSEEESATEASNTFWNVVGQLVGTDQACDDYVDKTFVPTIGDAKEGSETIREVVTNGAAAAAERFAGLVGLEPGTISEETSTYTWHDEAVGTLTYTKTTDGSSLATVDVSIRQVPQLYQLVYLTSEQQGKNASSNGTAWYRFGDIVSKDPGDGSSVSYWICVRPAFDKEGKGDSHWISVSPLPGKNRKSFSSSSYETTYVLPTKLGTSTEHMQNLAEMLYAIYNPDDWRQHITDHSSVNIFGHPTGLPIFHDFHSTNLKYHAPLFWQRVAKAWKDEGIEQKVFGLNGENLKELVNAGNLYFLANGYSWVMGNAPTLYQYRYSSGDKDLELNQHKQTYSKVSKNVVNPVIPLDFSQLFPNKPYIVSEAFFGDASPRFVIRFASGKELMGRQPSSYQSMNDVNGIKDVYVYNKYYNITPGKDTPPEILQDFVGESHYKPFDVYKDEAGNRWFPIYRAGRNEKDEKSELDHSAYTYLISFEGLEYSDDGQRAVNLPTRDVAVKAIYWLLVQMNNSLQMDNLDVSPSVGVICKHLIDNAGFDPRHIARYALPPDNPEDRLRDVYVSSVGYTEGDDADPKHSGPQKLLRYIVYPQGDRMPYIYIWQHYPSADNANHYEPIFFDDDLILLQDVANPDIVAKRAPDSFSQFEVPTGFYKNMPQASKQRKEADQQALKASNYAYNMASWNQYQQLLDMWNAPVLLFRITRVFDNGDSAFDKITEDGHKLTLFKEAAFYADANDPATLFVSTIYRFLNNMRQKMFFDGQPYSISLWHQDVIRR